MGGELLPRPSGGAEELHRCPMWSASRRSIARNATIGRELEEELGALLGREPLRAHRARAGRLFTESVHRVCSAASAARQVNAAPSAFGASS